VDLSKVISFSSSLLFMDRKKKYQLYKSAQVLWFFVVHRQVIVRWAASSVLQDKV